MSLPSGVLPWNRIFGPGRRSKYNSRMRNVNITRYEFCRRYGYADRSGGCHLQLLVRAGYSMDGWKVHKLTKIHSCIGTKWGLFFNIVPFAVNILFLWVLLCLDPIRRKSHQQHIWRHHINFSAQPWKVLKDHLTRLLWGNVESDNKLKPLLIYRTLNPRILNVSNKQSLLKILRSNRKTWLFKSFKNGSHHISVQNFKKYCKKNNLAFKVLLIWDNAPRGVSSWCNG